jgi:hypothetical protein
MNGTDLLTRIQTFKRSPLEIEDGVTVFVREVSAAEAAEYAKRAAAPDADDLDNAAWLAARVLVDADGAQLLKDDQAEKVKAFPLRVLKAIGRAAAQVSGWATDDAAKKNDVES